MAGASGYSAATTHIRGRVSRYRILEQLGEGGMGVVYLARDETLGRNVALKLLSERLAGNDQFRERFVRESRLAAATDHPNIIPVYEAGEADGRLFIAMRFVRGMDLAQVLAASGPLPAARALAIVDQIGRALDAAHRAGLVHRDVKPANVMIDASEGAEHCYLTDFGLTKNISSNSGFTETGQFLGTLNYMAPEQIEGAKVDARSDLYALGCVLFECLCGAPPFRRDSDIATMYAHLREPVPKACVARPDLPPSVDDVLARAMAKAQVDRHGSCAEMVTELRAAVAGVHVPSFRPSVAGTGRRFQRPATPPPPPTDPAPPPARPPLPRSAPRRHPSQPPTYTMPPAANDGGRSYTRAAAIVAIAILLCAAGIAAALVLKQRDGGPETTAADGPRVDKQLIDRTVRLRRELITVDRRVRRQRTSAAGPGLERRLAADLREARSLLRASRKQEAASAAGAKELATANTRLGKVVKILQKWVANPVEVPTLGPVLTAAGSDVEAARNADPVPDLPRVGTTPLPNLPAQSVRVPDDAVATVDAGPGGTITALENVGDLDGDGEPDLGAIATVDGADEPHAFVAYGGAGDVDLSDLGEDSGFDLGAAWSLSRAGDANGDGSDDVALIGPGEGDGAAVFVVSGTDGALDAVDLTALGSAGREIDLPVSGEQPNSIEDGIAGYGVDAAGDVDGDGVDDLVVGDPFAENGNGAAWIVYGDESSDDPISLEPGDGGEAVQIHGGGGSLGGSVAGANDVNGDDLADVIVGASALDGGAAYVVYGSTERLAVDVTALDDQGFQVTTGADTAALGAVVLPGGDMNGDGNGDVVVTAPRASAAYAVFGADGDVSDVDVEDLGTSGFEVRGAAPTAATQQYPTGLGSSAAPAGDVNGDGSADFVLGAPGASSGAIAYVIFGSGDSATVDIAQPGGRVLSIDGPAPAAAAPMPVAGDVDLDGDDSPDALLAPAGDEGAASAYAVTGKP